MENIMTVSQAARRLSRSEQWLRQAEKKGSIPRARRNFNGWRVYTEEDIEKLESLLVPER